jgi:transposase
MSMHCQRVLGIDTHKHTHVAVVLSGLGRREGVLQFPSTDAGVAGLLAWSRDQGTPLIAGVEGTGSYGYQLTRALQAAGMTVVEVNRPDRAPIVAARARATRSTPKPRPERYLPARRPRSRRTAKVQ